MVNTVHEGYLAWAYWSELVYSLNLYLVQAVDTFYSTGGRPGGQPLAKCDIKANSAQFELELGLRLAKLKKKRGWANH